MLNVFIKVVEIILWIVGILLSLVGLSIITQTLSTLTRVFAMIHNGIERFSDPKVIAILCMCFILGSIPVVQLLPWSFIGGLKIDKMKAIKKSSVNTVKV